MIKCKNCGHQICHAPPHYLGRNKWFHYNGRDTGETCFNKKCMCEKAEKRVMIE